MKKIFVLAVSVLALALLFAGCSDILNVTAPGSTDTEGVEYLIKGIEAVPNEYPLYAGQDWLVGKVLVWSDNTNVCVEYVLDEDIFNDGWGITETHFAIGSTADDIPQENGNPIPGKFTKKVDGLEGVSIAGPYCINYNDLGLDIECGDGIVVAAHAVVRKTIESCDDPVVLLATENNHPSGASEMEARIYEITVSGNATMISNIIAPVQSNTDNFNGNAFDESNSRFYFSDYPDLGNGTSPLYFNDLSGNQEFAGNLVGAASGGTFYGGYYYYIDERTDDLREVTVDGSGHVVLDTKIADIFNNMDNSQTTGKVLAFGDIDTDGINIYGSATEIPDYNEVFFSLNLDGTGYTVIASSGWSGAGGTQIAFGSDGVLYGVNARSPFALFSINPVDGVITPICNMPVAFSDLASGPVCVPQYEEETAWGAMGIGEEDFLGNNWATYINYTIECPDCLEDFLDGTTDTLWQIGTPHGAVNPIDGSAEYPATGSWVETFNYVIGFDSDPIYAPNMPGYIGSCNVCDNPTVNDGRPCTDTTERLNIQFELSCSHVAGELVLIYDRYGSETDTLYFDFDGVPFATVVATEGGFKQFALPLPASAAGIHTITIAYEGGGDANGHYIDYLKLVVTP